MAAAAPWLRAVARRSRGIDYVHNAFYSAGRTCATRSRGAGWQPFPTYRDLMVADDGEGKQRSYIASEEICSTLRDMQERNLIVPLVGDSRGPSAAAWWLATSRFTTRRSASSIHRTSSSISSVRPTRGSGSTTTSARC